MAELYDTLSNLKKYKPDGEIPLKNSTPKVEDNELDSAFKGWQAAPNPAAMSHLLSKLKPTISSGMISYAGGANPILMGRAKRIAIDAIKSYKPESKATLKSWVLSNMQGLQRYANNLNPMSLPERVKIENSQLFTAAQEYEANTGRKPNDYELADLTGMSHKRIKYIRKIAVPTVAESQFDGDGDDDGGESGFVPGVESNNWQNIWTEYVYNDLDPINKKLFDMKMGRGEHKGQQYSVDDIAKELRMTPAAVSQRSNKIAEKLSQMFAMKDKL